jgi:alpha-beta hydrolase superfamily lysophospholipase
LGFGASSGERGDISRWSLFLDQLEGNLESTRTEGRPLILMGHSMGGLIALDYALAERPHPDLLILSSPLLAGGKAWQISLVPRLARLFPGLRLPVEITGDQLSRDPRVGEVYFQDPLVLTKVSVRLGASILSAQKRVLSALEGLVIPTIVIHGGEDHLVPTMCSQALTTVPCVVRRVFPDLRHETLNEPEGPEVVAEIIDWIASKTS